jgi:hypothetical protein
MFSFLITWQSFESSSEKFDQFLSIVQELQSLLSVFDLVDAQEGHASPEKQKTKYFRNVFERHASPEKNVS